MTDPWSPHRPGPGGETRVEPIVTVITPTIADRFDLLHEAMESVRRQTLAGVEHSVELDTESDGPAVVRNRMLARVTTPLVAFLDDDDVLDPDHLERLHARLESAHSDVAYSWHRNGPKTPRPRRWLDALRYMRAGRNVIPVTVLAKTESILDAGGFDPDDRYEDHALWLRMIERGCTFALEPAVTWTYRIAPDGRTYTG